MGDKLLTQNILIKGIPGVLLEEDFENMDKTPITRRLQFSMQYKKKLSKRWINEYLDSLEEPPHKKTEVSSCCCQPWSSGVNERKYQNQGPTTY